MEMLEKVSNIIKNKFNSELIYSKKYVKACKKINIKGVFQLTVCFYHVSYAFQNESREVYPEWV